ncbi:MAG TPA: peptidoglycan binding domain-containing protein, partial [Candidatus Binatia bacterium]|nr:peptidoglycan binding domain-containing protein [Candidatus Binatia bacterium]
MRHKRSSLGKKIKRAFLLLLLTAAIGFLGYQFWLYRQARANFPAGTTIAGLPVDGMSSEEARAYMEEKYLQPVIIYHRSERIEMDPTEIGFDLDLDGMIGSAEEAHAAQNFWMGYLFYMLNWTWKPIRIPLQASYDPDRLKMMIETIAELLDQPGQDPQILSSTAVFEPGKSGFVTDVDASLPLVERALYRTDDRTAELVVVDQDAPELNFELLEAVIRSKLSTFDGLGSIFVMDLQTGEEIRINSDVAMSGMSILKIGIFIEAYRHIDLPLNDYEQQLFLDTATRSSNYAANLLLHIVAGEENTYKGADIFTQTMWELG